MTLSPRDVERAAAADTETVDSRTLLRGGSGIAILHHGETYRLWVGKLGELILTE